MNLDRVKEKILSRYFLYLLTVILFLILLFIQLQIWFGDYSYSKLNYLKQEIKVKQHKIQEIEKNNFELEQEKRILISGKNAIEGIARSELGLIKSGEIFYKFKIKEQKSEEKDPDRILKDQ